MSEVETVASTQDHEYTDSDVGEIMANYNPDDMISVYCTNIMCCAFGQSTHKNHVGEFCWACGRGVTYPRGLSRLNWSSLDQNDDYKHGEIPSFLIDVITLDDWELILDHIDQIDYCGMHKIPTSFQRLTQNQWDKICNNLSGGYGNCRKYLNPEFCPSVLTNVLTLDEWCCICEKFNMNIDVYIDDSDNSDDDYDRLW
jgi:hypothetical protein